MTTTKPKRLDGKKKLVSLTRQMEKDMRLYCRDRGIDSLRKSAEELKDMTELMFKYLTLMHTSLLAYNPEIVPELADAAFRSATARHEKFFSAYQDSLKNDPPFFERLLHTYYTGAHNDGQN